MLSPFRIRRRQSCSKPNFQTLSNPHSKLNFDIFNTETTFQTKPRNTLVQKTLNLQKHRFTRIAENSPKNLTLKQHIINQTQEPLKSIIPSNRSLSENLPLFQNYPATLAIRKVRTNVSELRHLQSRDDAKIVEDTRRAISSMKGGGPSSAPSRTPAPIKMFFDGGGL